MTESKWVAISNAFVPFDPVPPDRLGEWFVTRPDSPVEILVRQLSPDRVPERHILVGQLANGKSSELTKLAEELNRRYDALVVRFDMTDNTDVERANPVEVIFLIGVALFKVAASELPKNRQPDRQLLEDLKSGLETLVHTHTENKKFAVSLDKLLTGLIVFGGTALAGPVGAATGLAVSPAAAKAVGKFAEKFNPFRFTSGTDTNIVRKLEVEPHVEAMVESLNAIIDDVRSKADRPLVLLVDGLDKLRDPDVIALNFLEKKFLNGPRCSVLYTGPLDLYYLPQFGGVRARFPITPFSHVKLHDRDNPEQINKHGYQVMREVVRCRLQSLDLEPEEVIVPAALNMLIKGSGGVMRDFIRLVQSAALQAEIGGRDHITEDDSKLALSELRRQLQVQLTLKYREVIDVIQKTHKRTDDPECDVMLQNGLILSYLNDGLWFNAHPLLWR